MFHKTGTVAHPIGIDTGEKPEWRRPGGTTRCHVLRAAGYKIEAGPDVEIGSMHSQAVRTNGCHITVLVPVISAPIAIRTHPLSCIKPAFADRGIVRSCEDTPMRRFAMKALFTGLALRRAKRKRIDWDRNVLIFSPVVTVGLIALYAYGKATSRW
jgi:hypothetical protein